MVWRLSTGSTRPARQGHVSAQYGLGKLLLSDDPEVRDTELAIQWLEYATHHGSDLAAYRLGKEYLKGEIVKRDITKAAKYLTQSAEAGNQYAQYALGKLYLDKQDGEQAHYWFTQSAAQGNEYAQFFLDRWDDLKPPSVMLSVTRLLHQWVVFSKSRRQFQLSLVVSKSTESGWYSSEKRKSLWDTSRTIMRNRSRARRCRWGSRQLHHRLQRELATPNMISF